MSDATSIERRLTAVAFADVAGYSRMMGEDDVRTVLRWKALRRDLIEPKIAVHRGRLLRVVGDGLLLEFKSVVDAVQWANDVQTSLAAPEGVSAATGLALRIGINVEDVLIDGDEMHGDGVNIAARIQQVAQPGETVVTAAVKEHVWNKVDAGFDDLGEHQLKNIERRVQVYRLAPRRGVAPIPATERRVLLAWDRRPSVAILPFRNAGGDPDEDYFGEGITEDIITKLSRTRSLFVIARNSTLRYRSRHVDVGQIAQELNVRYVVEGTVRRASPRLRISCELIDVTSNRALWADRFDGANDALFEFQDRIALSIVGAIEPKVREAEMQNVLNKPTERLDAYDCLLRALPSLNTFDPAKLNEALTFLDRALALDPGYAQAHAYKAWVYLLLIAESRSRDVGPDAELGREHALRAISLDPNDAYVLAVAGHVHALLHRQPDVGAQLFQRALEVNENSAFAWGMSGLTYCYLARPDEAHERFSRALRLSPYDPMIHFWLAGMGLADFVAGRYQQALPSLYKARHVNHRFLAGLRHLITCLAHSGQMDEARRMAKELITLEPNFRVSQLASWYPLRPEESLKRYIDGLRLAGLPE